MRHFFFKRTKDFVTWLSDRCADLSRRNMRSILRHLRLPFFDVLAAVKYVKASSVADSFWIRGETEDLCYADVSFSSDIYYKAALSGDPNLFDLPAVPTPEITNIGSFNKGWKLVDGSWVLYKSGKPLELFSELFASKLALKLGFNAVEYFTDSGFIASNNFVTPGLCFEPAKSLIGSSIDYFVIYDIMENYGLGHDYLDIIFMDALVRNSDRHEFNYGFLTDVSGNIVKLAPNFDNNMSLFWNGIPDSSKRKDILVTDFVEIFKNVNYSPPEVSRDLLSDVFEKTVREFPCDIDKAFLIDFCLNAYRSILSAHLPEH